MRFSVSAFLATAACFGAASAQSSAPDFSIKPIGETSASSAGKDSPFSNTDLVPEDVSNFLLTGWHSDCGEDDFECTGIYRSSSEPKPLDPTGSTCYVNPYKSPQDAVFWYGQVPAYANTSSADYVFSHTVVLHPNEASTYLPTNCTSDGFCDCGPFEEVRSGWDAERSLRDVFDWCKFPSISCSISQVSLAERDCNINYRVSHDTGGEVSRTCVLMASLVQVTGAPTGAPSGAMTFATFWSVCWTCVVALIGTLVLVN